MLRGGQSPTEKKPVLYTLSQARSPRDRSMVDPSSSRTARSIAVWPTKIERRSPRGIPSKPQRFVFSFFFSFFFFFFFLFFVSCFSFVVRPRRIHRSPAAFSTAIATTTIARCSSIAAVAGTWPWTNRRGNVGSNARWTTRHDTSFVDGKMIRVWRRWWRQRRCSRRYEPTYRRPVDQPDDISTAIVAVGISIGHAGCSFLSSPFSAISTTTSTSSTTTTTTNSRSDAPPLPTSSAASSRRNARWRGSLRAGNGTAKRPDLPAGSNLPPIPILVYYHYHHHRRHHHQQQQQQQQHYRDHDRHHHHHHHRHRRTTACSTRETSSRSRGRGSLERCRGRWLKSSTTRRAAGGRRSPIDRTTRRWRSSRHRHRSRTPAFLPVAVDRRRSALTRLQCPLTSRAASPLAPSCCPSTTIPTLGILHLDRNRDSAECFFSAVSKPVVYSLFISCRLIHVTWQFCEIANSK